MGITLALLLGIPALLLLGLRRLGLRLPGQPDGGGRLGIVSRVAIDGKHSLLLVRRDGREQLLLLGPSGPTVLEAEVTLSRSDRAVQRRRVREEQARVAANRARLEAAKQRSAQQVQRAAMLLLALARRLFERTRPSFHRLVAAEIRSHRPAAPAPAPRPARARRKRAA